MIEKLTFGGTKSHIVILPEELPATFQPLQFVHCSSSFVLTGRDIRSGEQNKHTLFIDQMERVIFCQAVANLRPPKMRLCFRGKDFAGA